MRILVYSDLHLNCWANSTYINGRNSRLVAQQNVLEQMRTYCMNNEIFDMFFCGDAFHTQGKVDSEVLNAAWESFGSIYKSGIKQIWLVGNHDQKDKAGRIHSLSFLNEFGTVVYDDFWCSLGCFDPLTTFSFLSYTEDKEKLEKFFSDPDLGDICFIHQGVSGVSQPSGFFIDEIFSPDLLPDHVRHVFAGHYHTYNHVNERITIPGSPMPLYRGDEKEKHGWLDVTIPEEGELKIKFVEAKYPNFFEDKHLKDNEKEEGPELRVDDFSDLAPVIHQFSTKKNLSPRAIEVGKELQESKYEIPQTKN